MSKRRMNPRPARPWWIALIIQLLGVLCLLSLLATPMLVFAYFIGYPRVTQFRLIVAAGLFVVAGAVQWYFDRDVVWWRIHRKRGRCPVCLYDTHGSRSERCTECGTALTR